MDTSLAHSKSECHYHIVFIPKYRRKVLYGEIREAIKEIIVKLCEYKHVRILAGAVCIDHVHLVVDIPAKMSVSQFVGYLKGKSALEIHDRYPEKVGKYDKSFWARGYFAKTIGTVSEKTVLEYVEEQGITTKQEELRERGHF